MFSFAGPTVQVRRGLSRAGHNVEERAAFLRYQWIEYGRVKVLPHTKVLGLCTPAGGVTS
jgi:hypothetical protein